MTTLEKPIIRKTARPFLHYAHHLVITLLPGDVMILREARHKREVTFNLHSLYFEGLRRLVAAEKREKQKARRQRYAVKK